MRQLAIINIIAWGLLLVGCNDSKTLDNINSVNQQSLEFHVVPRSEEEAMEFVPIGSSSNRVIQIFGVPSRIEWRKQQSNIIHQFAYQYYKEIPTGKDGELIRRVFVLLVNGKVIGYLLQYATTSNFQITNKSICQSNLMNRVNTRLIKDVPIKIVAYANNKRKDFLDRADFLVWKEVGHTNQIDLQIRFKPALIRQMNQQLREYCGMFTAYFYMPDGKNGNKNIDRIGRMVVIGRWPTNATFVVTNRHILTRFLFNKKINNKIY